MEIIAANLAIQGALFALLFGTVALERRSELREQQLIDARAEVSEGA